MNRAQVETARGVLSGDLDENIAYFRNLLHADVNSDAHFRPFKAGDARLCVIYIEGMASDQKISDFILRA